MQARTDLVTSDPIATDPMTQYESAAVCIAESGPCVYCHAVKNLRYVHPDDRNLPREDRRRICVSCYTRDQRIRTNHMNMTALDG